MLRHCQDAHFSLHFTVGCRLGIEGLVQYKQDGSYDAENYVLTLPETAGAHKGKKVAIFDKVVVAISVEKDKNTQRGKVKMELAV